MKHGSSLRRGDALGRQIAALPLQQRKGKLRVLLITSRGTGRWVPPKGWLMPGKAPWEAAKIEALEEAGAKGEISNRRLGSYLYDKIFDNGAVLPCRVKVYPMLVERLLTRWKERDERERAWMSPKKAASLVNEPELADLLTSIASDPMEHKALRRLLS